MSGNDKEHSGSRGGTGGVPTGSTGGTGGTGSPKPWEPGGAWGYGGAAGTPGAPVYPGMPTVTQMQPHLPGMIDMITSQILKGFGTAPTFNDMYKPMNLVNYPAPISSVQDALNSKTKGATKYAAPNTGIPILDTILKTPVKPPTKDTTEEKVKGAK